MTGLSGRTCWILLAGILLAHLAVNLLWVRSDRTMRGFDEPHHVVSAAHALNLVRAHGFKGLWQAVRGRRAGQWPSAGYVPWVPPGLVLGSSLASLRLFNMGYLALLALSLLLLGRRLHSPSAGLLAAVLCSLYPAIFGAGRHFNQDLPYVAVVAMCMALLLWTERFGRSLRSLLLGLGVGFAVLVRPHSAILLAAPGICWVLFSLARPTRRGATARDTARDPRWRLLLNMLLCGGAAAGVTAIWWAFRLEHIQEIFFAHYEGHNMFSWMKKQSSLLYYIKGFPAGITLASLLMLAAASVGLAAGGQRSGPRAGLRPRPEMVLIWIWLAGGLLLLSLFRVHLNRYQYPLFPAVALLTGCGLVSLGRLWLRRGVVAAALALGLAGWLLCSFVADRPSWLGRGAGAALPPGPPDQPAPWRPSLLDCDPNCSREFGEPFESSGPPHEDTLLTAGLQVAAWLDAQHGSGQGLLLQIPNQLRVAMMIKPALLTSLPLVQISHRDLRAYGENQTGEECEAMHQTLGGYSFPLPHLPFSHCYTITDEFRTKQGPQDPPPGPVAGARKVMQTRFGWRDGRGVFRLWKHLRCPERAEPFIDHEKGGIWLPCK